MTPADFQLRPDEHERIAAGILRNPDKLFWGAVLAEIDLSHDMPILATRPTVRFYARIPRTPRV